MTFLSIDRYIWISLCVLINYIYRGDIMYGFHITNVSTVDFFNYLRDRELLKSHSILKTDRDKHLKVIQSLGLNTLGKLANALKTKARALKTFVNTDVTEEYIVILRRQVNSFVSKPRKLNEFMLIDDSTVKSLLKINIITTKDLFLQWNQVVFKEACMDYLKAISILTQLRYVGHGYAESLYLSGYKTIESIATVDPVILVGQINATSDKFKLFKITLGLSDATFLVEDAKLFLKWY